MTHADDPNETVHTVFTWIGVAGFAVGVLGIPLGNFLLDASIDPLYAVVIVIASIAAVGSKQVTDAGARLIRAWRSGG